MKLTALINSPIFHRPLRRIFAVALVLALVLSVAPPARCESEERPTTALDVAFLSKYVWRGYELSNGSMVVQPSATIGYKGFGMNLWGNLDTDLAPKLDGNRDRSEPGWTETDMTLSYSNTFGMVNAGAGYIYYGLDGMDDSQEVYASAGLDIFLAPTLTLYREVSHTPAWYLQASVSHGIALPREMSLNLSASASYYYSDDDAFAEPNNPSEKYRDFHSGLLSASLAIPFATYFTITPNLAYSFPLSSNAKDLLTAASISKEASFFYGGVTCSMAF
ncbi:MAG: hypothetical protein ABIL58_06980 [Pseudomonadota bacterium]